MSHVLYAFVEGGDDERFFNRVIKPELLKKHSKVRVFKYAQSTRLSLERSLVAIKNSGATYIFFSDLDRVKCYTRKKEIIISKTIKNIDKAKIVIVKSEIESWYMAGLSCDTAASLNIRHFRNTETMTKEDFEKICKKYPSRIDCMIRILEKFSVDMAKTQNQSFRYFCDKFL